nr:bone morphogenetic protein receptor type-2 isoform X1 [Nothobranchius furzeri]
MSLSSRCVCGSGGKLHRFPETILTACCLFPLICTMEQKFLALILQGFFAAISHSSLLQKRRCAFQLNNNRVDKFLSAGQVNGSVQICEKTSCCIAIYKIHLEQLEVETLACGLEEMHCPESTCHGQLFKNPFNICHCSTDFCNANLTISPGMVELPHTQSYWAALAAVVVIASIAVFIIMIKWKRLKGELPSSHQDCSVEQSCSGQTKTSKNITDIELQEVLGRGNFATVFQGKHNKSVVAVKVYPADRRSRFAREKKIFELPLMMHRGIVEFLGTGQKPDSGSWFIVLQHAKYGSLHSFLCKHTTSWMLSINLCQSLSQGLSYLHSDILSHGEHKPPVAHRDLSSSNVLVTADGTCVLCDFGSSTILRSCSGFWGQNRSNMMTHAHCGTLCYMPPEILEGSVNLSSSSFLMQGDVYALGLILWEIWMRCYDLFEGGVAPPHRLPYEQELEDNFTLDKLMVHVSEMDKRPSIPDYWDKLPQGSELTGILTDCWDKDMDARLTAHCVVERLISLQSSYNDCLRIE